MPQAESKVETVEALRSRYCWGKLIQLPESRRQKVTTRVQGLPLSIRSQGLGIAQATLLREDTDESRFLADLIGAWLLNDAPALVIGTSSSLRTDRQKLLAAVMECADPIALGAATEEATALAGTVKLLASALAPEAVHEG